MPVRGYLVGEANERLDGARLDSRRCYEEEPIFNKPDCRHSDGASHGGLRV